ncbi:hypothetical protein RM697_00815 [Ichthyenterobacterium sp. W332]|uniref:DUF2147 domain-containing protein n=1 Tax=Microcosmobacter mediterraneus TaxID=3075607 RepID=A0ABU2YG55_9FLAO|nr:hypothetical protein [Ichthyenterobacterium sp. W332]MDT0557166.1 hypothetical protein [Ichthyenterobacterium sp. W332]
MKNIATIFFLLFGIIAMNAQSFESLWNTGKENTTVKIIKTGDLFEGFLDSSDNKKAPIGKLLIKDIKQSDGFYEGKIYVVKKKKWYKAKFELKSNILIITIYSGLMKKTVEWKKQN